MPDKVNPKKYEIFQPLLLAFMVIIGMILGQKIDQTNKPEQKSRIELTYASRTPTGLIDEAVRYIDARFIDSIGNGRLTDLAITSLIQNLDPFSVYLPAGVPATDEAISFEQAYGFSFKKIKQQWLITQINKHTSAVHVGLQVGDVLVKIQNKLPNLQSISSWQDDTLHLTVRKQESGSEINYLIPKQSIQLSRTVDRALVLSKQVGYIRIRHFGENTYDEFISALDTLFNKHHLRNYLIDIRDNSGGYLEECSRILNQLFEEKNILLVTTKGRTVRKTEYKTDGRQLFNIDQVIVLIDQGSASASEVFAGSFQDLKRGKVIGQPSYGKGLVQEQYMLSNGAALRLSVARFYLPSGRTIDFSGHYEPTFEELKAAQGKKMIVHKTVIPDILIPKDTSLNSPEWIAVTEMINERVLEQIATNRKGQPSKNVIREISNKFNASISLSQRKLIQGKQERITSLIHQAWALANLEFIAFEKEKLLTEKEIQAALRQIKP